MKTKAKPRPVLATDGVTVMLAKSVADRLGDASVKLRRGNMNALVSALLDDFERGARMIDFGGSAFPIRFGSAASPQTAEDLGDHAKSFVTAACGCTRALYYAVERAGPDDFYYTSARDALIGIEALLSFAVAMNETAEQQTKSDAEAAP